MDKSLNVAEVDMGLMSEKDILLLSSGEVTDPTIPHEIKFTEKAKTPYLEFSDNGLFSERIFGPSKDSLEGKNFIGRDQSIQARENKYGHIVLPIPYIPPVIDRNNSGIIHTIIGCTSPKAIGNIIAYKSFLARVHKDDQFYLDLKDATKITKHIKELSLTPTADPEENRYRYFEIKRELFSNLTTKVASKIHSKEALLRNAEVTVGAYAIASILARRDMRQEIQVTEELLRRSENSVQKSRSDFKTKQKLLTTRYRALINMLKSGLEYKDLTPMTLLVVPAGFRDATIVTDDSGSLKIQVSELSRVYYAPIISKSQTLKAAFEPIPKTSDEMYSGDFRWIRDIPINKDDFLSKCSNLTNDIRELVRTGLGQSLGKKEGILRQEVISKRCDYTGRGVIVPDPSLQLDEAGIPLKMLYKMTKDLFKEYVGGDQESINILEDELKGNTTYWNTIDKATITSKNDVTLMSSNSEVMKQIKVHRTFKRFIQQYRIILIRFPSLHQFNKLGFKIRVVYGNTIHFHPLVCTPFNADFDGDQMSVYLMMNDASIKEIDERLMPSRKILGSSGSPIIAPTQDAVLGMYYITLKGKDPEPKRFYDSIEEMQRDLEVGLIDIHDTVTVKTPRWDKSWFLEGYKRSLIGEGRDEIFSSTDHLDVYGGKALKNPDVPILKTEPNYDCKPVTSTVGRFVLNTVMPQDLGYVDRTKDPYSLEIDKVIDDKGNVGMTGGQIKDIIQSAVFKKNNSEMKYMLDAIKDLGYGSATKSGMSITMQELIPYHGKQEILDKASKEVEEMRKQGASDQEVVAHWKKVNTELTTKTLDNLPDTNSVKMMSVSGSRGNKTQISQLIGMRSIMSDPTGKEIPTPVKSSFLEGLDISEVFTASSATRKGMYDRSNRTKSTGEASRTMVYGAEDVTTYDGDCGDTEGLVLKAIPGHKKLSKAVAGKITLEDIKDEEGNIIYHKGEMIDIRNTEVIDKLYGTKGIRVRSPITCKSVRGVCCKCYGYMYDKLRFARPGDPVGMIAAQTLGEPGTQLTMRTFHTGGAAEGDVTSGFDRIKRMISTNDFKDTVEINPTTIPQADIVATMDKTRTGLPIYWKQLQNNEPIGEVDFGMFGIVYPQKYVEEVDRIARSVDLGYASEGIAITAVHFDTIARAMMNTFEVVYPGDSSRVVSEEIDWEELVSTNLKLVSLGKEPMVVTWVFRSVKALARHSKHILTSLTFQDINAVAARAALLNPIDRLTNPLSGTIASNAIPTGENLNKFETIIDKEIKDTPTRNELYEELDITTERPEQVIVENIKVGATPERLEKVHDSYEDTMIAWKAATGQQENIVPEEQAKEDLQNAFNTKWDMGTSDDQSDKEDEEFIVENTDELEDTYNKENLGWDLKTLETKWKTGQIQEDEEKDYKDYGKDKDSDDHDNDIDSYGPNEDDDDYFFDDEDDFNIGWDE